MDSNFSIGLSLKDNFTSAAKSVFQTSSKLTAEIEKHQQKLTGLGTDRRNLRSFERQSDSLKRLRNALVGTREEERRLKAEINRRGKAGERVTVKLVRDYDRARAATRRLEARQPGLTKKTLSLAASLRKAGVNTRNLASEQARLDSAYARTEKRVTQLGNAYQRQSAIQQQYDKSLQAAANYTFVGQGISQAANTGINFLSRPLNAMRRVERSKGDLRAIGIEDTGAIENVGKRLQKNFAYMDVADVIAGAYDIKSGIGDISDKEVAGLTELAAITAKATRASVADITKLTATAFNVFKAGENSEFKDDSALEFGGKLTAALGETVKKFKTTGPEMQQAIEGLGKGTALQGVSMYEQFAVLGMLQGALPGSESATAYGSIEENAAKAHEKLAEYGIDILGEDGKLLPTKQLLINMQEGLGSDFTAETSRIIQEAFGTETAALVFKSLWGQQDALVQNTKEVAAAAKKGAESTTEMARAGDRNNADSTLQKSLQAWRSASEAWGKAMIPVIEATAPLANAIAGGIEWAASAGRFSSTLIGTAVAVTGLAAIIGPTVAAFGGLVFASALLRKSFALLSMMMESQSGGGFDGSSGFGSKKGRGGKRGKRRGLRGVLDKGLGLKARARATKIPRWFKGGNLAASGLMMGTSIYSAATNPNITTGQVAKDGASVAGGWGGALVGAKTGAVLGSFLPGPGTAAGAAVGAVIGGIAGSALGTGIANSVENFFTPEGDIYPNSPLKSEADAEQNKGEAGRVTLTDAVAGQVETLTGTNLPDFLRRDTQPPSPLAPAYQDNSHHTYTINVTTAPSTSADQIAIEVEKNCALPSAAQPRPDSCNKERFCMNNTTMMSLGLFVFTVENGLYTKLTNQLDLVWHKKQALGLGPLYQYGGAGDHTVTLSGAIAPIITGKEASIDELKDMARTGKSWNMVDGNGRDRGAWFITNISADHTHFNAEGTARLIEFTVELTEAPDLEQLGQLQDRI